MFKFWPDTLNNEIACVSALVPRNLLCNLVTSVRPLLIRSTEVFLLVDVPGQSNSNPYHTHISSHTPKHGQTQTHVYQTHTRAAAHVHTFKVTHKRGEKKKEKKTTYIYTQDILARMVDRRGD